MARALVLLVLAIVASCALAQTKTAETTHVVGDSLGWVVPLGGPIVYATWAVSHTFLIGDILLFNFTTGQEDVARVTKEAFLTCNTTGPISLRDTGPANFTLDSPEEYYFIGTLDKHCILGQRLAINVTAYPGPAPAPAPPPAPRGPRDYTVGDKLGWLIPPGDPLDLYYESWAYNKTFFVGDTLVFNFFNGSDDVAVVTKQVFDSCNITSTIAVFNSTPANIALNATGENYYTSTYAKHCILGQKLAINVTEHATSGSAPSPSSTAHPPSIAVSPSSPPGRALAPSPNTSAPSPPAIAHPPSIAVSPSSPPGRALAPSPNTSAAPITAAGHPYFGAFAIYVMASAVYL
ncbi:blue copper protein-like [Cucurbita maxima]|uniref:Blue copper protein-like n=1 Tax=Cucurbita maxima TaxID=3661 RepID=A0A6J1KEJ6_CUCMA|nr:blue copper protein-like [Cucurbita maxima]